jgi:hypothetical protein
MVHTNQTGEQSPRLSEQSQQPPPSKALATNIQMELLFIHSAKKRARDRRVEPPAREPKGRGN